MVQAKRQVKSRVAPSGAFGVQQHRALAAQQNILGADVAMNQRFGMALGLQDQGVQCACQIGMALRRGY